MKATNQRRKRPRKKKLRRKYRNRRIALVVVLAAVVFGGLFAFSSMTGLTDVRVTGTKAVPKNAVVKIAEESRGKSYFRLNKGRLKNRLEQMPYVKEATIGLNFPHTLTIKIEEEKPFAQLYSDEGYILVNEDFKALENTRSYNPNMPKVTGLVTEGVRLGQVAFKSTGNEKKIHMIKTLFASPMKKDIHTVSILDRGMRIGFSDGTMVHILSFDDAEYKTKQLEEIRNEMKAKNEDYREIYLDQGDHPVAVKPSSLDDEGTENEESSNLLEGEKDSNTDKKEKKPKKKKASKNESDEDENTKTGSNSVNTAE